MVRPLDLQVAWQGIPTQSKQLDQVAQTVRHHAHHNLTQMQQQSLAASQSVAQLHTAESSRKMAFVHKHSYYEKKTEKESLGFYNTQKELLVQDEKGKIDLRA